MKQRVTYLLPEGHELDPGDIHVTTDSLTYAHANDAAVEKRVTAGLSELPQDLRALFDDLHELHIRFQSRTAYNATSPSPSPIPSRLPPGLHVFFTPRNPSASRHPHLCPLFRQLFGPELKCHSTADSFSQPPLLSERFSTAASNQYFSPLPRLLHFQTALARLLCGGGVEGECVGQVASLSYATSLDLDFDAISHAVTLTGFWRAGLPAESGKGVPGKGGASDRLEVGVLAAQKPEEPEELKLGGFLTVVGEDSRPSPTLFSFPSRHHPLPEHLSALTYVAAFQQPTGLHPKLDITFPQASLLNSPPKDDGSCALHAYLTLPSALFLDRYQLDDDLFLASQNLVALRALSGEDDLEAPDWVVKRWGSAALFELATPSPAPSSPSSPSDDEEEDDDEAAGDASPWTVTIPTHLRYLSHPSANTPSNSTHFPLDIPHPHLFWACEAAEGLKMSVNPFDRTNLGYDGLFGPKTMFYHLAPEVAEEQQAGLVGRLRVPVLAPERAWYVQGATLAVVAVGFWWVVWKMVGGRGGKKGTEAGEKKRQ